MNPGGCGAWHNLSGVHSATINYKTKFAPQSANGIGVLVVIRNFSQKSSRRKKYNPFVRAGIPLICLVVGGSYLLSTFVQGKVEAKDAKQKSQTKRQFDLTEEYNRAMKDLSVDDSYSTKRIPRPSDENTS
mmetsp:Transcript_4407/g.6878  ORF Transcript_4407/g.6878 Transcript_4407/m.6878 type:complete len:131 (-) Transcript_4407:393-785(-)